VALRRYDVLDTAAETAFDRVTALASRLFGTPVALVSLVDECRQWFKSRVGLDVEETPRDLAFCAHTIRGADVLVVPDARADPRFAVNPLVTGRPGIRFYAGAPLRSPDGHALGTLCVIDFEPRPPLSAGEEDTLRALAAVVVDALEQRLALRARAEAERRAEAASRSKSQFLAMMSHELRTPMTGVLGLLDLLADTRLDAEQSAYVDKLRRSADALLVLLNDILDLSKIEAGRIELEAVPFDPAELAEEAAQLFAPAAAGRGVALETDVEPEPGPRLLGDPARVRQVLLNLVGNAVKFTERGGVHLSLRTRPLEAGAELRIRVSDTGIGMTREQMDRLFEPFAQADASTTRRYGGTGLGLAICRRLVAEMGGAIRAESEPGAGSTFHVAIPLPRAEGPAEGGPEGGTEGGAETAPPGGAGPTPRVGRVLVAEDNEINSVLISTMLRRLGLETETVGDGERAVEAVARGGVDLVLMDVQMPVMDGMEATRRIRALPAPAGRVPIVALTADALPEHAAGYMATGLDAVLTKPIDRRALAETIERLIGRRDPH
jgi:signal transduction histidine kinase